jgi:hypothetical protein
MVTSLNMKSPTFSKGFGIRRVSPGLINLKPIEKSKIENLATLLQLARLVRFLAMAEKIRNTRGKFP